MIQTRTSTVSAFSAFVLTTVPAVSAFARIDELCASKKSIVTTELDNLARGPAPELTTNLPASRWATYVAKRLQEIGQHEYDLSDLKMPEPAVIHKARLVAGETFIPSLPSPSVLPTSEGSVLFVWRTREWDVNLEVSMEETFVWMKDRSTGDETHGSFEVNLESFWNFMSSASATVLMA